MAEPADRNVQWLRLESGVLVPVRAGDGSPEATKAVQDVLQPPGASLLAPWRSPGGPGSIRAAYELLRRQVNGLTRIIDGLLIGAHASSYGGNIRLLNRTRSRSVMGQHLVDPIVDERRPSHPAMRFLHSVRGRRRAVDLNRASFVFERILSGDVTDGGRPFIQLAERLGDGATATGAWLEDALRTFSIQHDGTFFSQGGLFLFGSSAHAILRGGSAFLEGGGNLVLMGQGVTADDASGYACALAAGAPGQLFIGDLYSSIDISAFLYGDLNLLHAIDGLPSKITSGYQVLRELSDAQITALGTPAAGTGFVYVRQADERLYFKNDGGTTFDLTGGGTGTHSASGPDNAVAVAVTLEATATGAPPVPGTGFGVGMELSAQNAALVAKIIGRIAAVYSSAASTNEFAHLVFEAIEDGAMVEVAQFQAPGALTLPRLPVSANAPSGDRSSLFALNAAAGHRWASIDELGVVRQIPYMSDVASRTRTLYRTQQATGTSLTYAMPANTLAANGDMLEIYCRGITGTSTEQFRLRLGASTIFAASTVGAGDPWLAVVRIIRTGSAAQVAFMEFVRSTSTGGVGDLLDTPGPRKTFTEDLTTALNLVLDYSTANDANRIVYYLEVKLSPAP